MLVFDVELLGIQPTPGQPPQMQAPPTPPPQ
jgi:hypothetical protein